MLNWINADDFGKRCLGDINPILAGRGHRMAPSNFEAFLLRDDASYYPNLALNLVTWYPISKYLLCLSYTNCEEMIKLDPAKLGLKS